MLSLSRLFNARRFKSIDRTVLFDTVKPFLKDTDHFTNADIADGLDEAIEWLRIGFHCEKDKGTNYQAMRRALMLIKRQVLSAPEGGKIDICKEDLRILKTGYFQLEQAAQYLEFQENHAASAPQQIVADRQGNSLVVPSKQIYNRPQSDYLQAAAAVRQFSKNLDKLFEGIRIREAHHSATISYSQQHPR